MDEKEKREMTMTDEQLTRLLRDVSGVSQADKQKAEAQARAELRDRFAGYALIGLLASGECSFISSDETAALAWKQADAMMKARGQ
jgi:hypothetical protein